MKFYTGIGSRNTPCHIQEMIVKIAYKLAGMGYTLRSGAAQGADSAFERGASHWFEDNGESYPAPASLMQIYIPWDSFVSVPEDYKDCYKSLARQSTKHQAEQIASEIHPAWERCSRGAKALHSRNVYQILGVNLNTPSSFLIAYAEPTKDGGVKGGTATAWNLAKKYNIPCFNLYVKEDRDRLEKWLEENGDE